MAEDMDGAAWEIRRAAWASAYATGGVLCTRVRLSWAAFPSQANKPRLRNIQTPTCATTWSHIRMRDISLRRIISTILPIDIRRMAWYYVFSGKCSTANVAR
jgi:hypothetical protein